MQFIKFCLVGVSNTIVNLAVYYLILMIDQRLYLAANVIAWVVSVLNAFIWNNRLVFAGEKERAWKDTWVRLMRTYIAYGATMLLGTVLLHVEVEIWGISRFLAPVINLFITTPVNFITNKFWAFAKRKGKDAV